MLAILLGRLRNAFGESSSPTGNGAVGVLLCGALHPLLWAPLRTLGQQSIMGAFPSLCVPCLSQEAASAMMRGLGARQGIRFADDALVYVVQQSQGVPLLLRRIGTSLLELYDADHARQGGLGAVNVGREGAREAVAREETEGAPLRVWVESEIAERAGPAGAIRAPSLPARPIPLHELRHVAEASVLAQFASSGIMRWTAAPRGAAARAGGRERHPAAPRRNGPAHPHRGPDLTGGLLAARRLDSPRAPAVAQSTVRRQQRPTIACPSARRAP